MFIYLSKLLPLFLLPLGLGLELMVLGLLLCRRGRRRAAWALGLGAVIVLGLPSLPACSDQLLLSLERQYPVIASAQAPAADAIVILGGGTAGSGPTQPEVELAPSGERLLHGLRLWRAGKARLLLLSGGSLYTGEPEAEQMRQILSAWGVPASAMVLEDRSRNTYENAVESTALAQRLGLRRLLLVTSAFHMPRAAALFRRQGEARGLTILPSATGQMVSGRRPLVLLRFLPDAGALAASTLALREQLGLLTYRLRGWL